MEEATHIVLTSWITTTVAMIPLFFLGLGLLKGFALTTIAGITIGVFITRPAYREVIKVITKKLEKERLNKV
jgi:preprotein translocase subunit SecD